MNWYLKCIKESFNFSGRARCREYWMFILIHGLISVLLNFLSEFLSPLAILASLYPLVLLPATYSVLFRRLHDTNHSGWNALLPGIFLILGGGLVFLLSMCAEIVPAVIIVLGIIFFLGFAFLNFRLLYLTLKSSDIGPNRYGEDPIGDPDRKPNNRTGCFIVIVLVSLFIMVILAAMLLPALAMAREKARQVTCFNNLKRIHAALSMYAIDNANCYPMTLEDIKGIADDNITCSANENHTPYQLLDSARGLNLDDVKNPAETPVIACPFHKRYFILLYADGHIGTLLPENVSDEIYETLPSR